jgi:VWFA-related protein
MPDFKRILSIFTLACWLALPGLAQEKQPEEQVATIRVNTDLVSVDVLVYDRHGQRSTANLRAEDFVVYEDGVPQKISNFSVAEAPFNLVLLIDTSGSTRDELGLIEKAARRFLTELRPQDRVAIIQFSQEVELLKDLTSDRGGLERGLALLTPGSGTSYYDALQLALDEVLRKVEGRKAVVALTDGVDSYGFNIYDQVLPRLERGGTAFYFLELNTEAFTEERMLRDCDAPNHFKFSRKQLKKYFDEFVKSGLRSHYDDHCKLARMEKLQINRRLYEAARAELREVAEKTGGRVYPLKNLQQLEPAYAQIADELRTQYSFAYYPSNEKRDGKWRTLRIELKKPGLTVRAKPGYRAPLD